MMMPDDKDLSGFQNLQILTLKITGHIPIWLGDMPNLYVLNLTQNFLSGQLPGELGRMQGLIADNSSTDYLSCSTVSNTIRLFNLPRGLKVGNNTLSGDIPQEIGRLKLLLVLDLSNNEFNGSIPSQLSGNHLSGEIPESLKELHFLSSFSVANNDLRGEIPRGGQFDTFSAASFEANPKLCGYLIRRLCLVNDTIVAQHKHEHKSESSKWHTLPFGLGYFVGVVAILFTLLYKTF